MCYLQPSVDTLDVVVMETGQHPQLLSVGVVTETDLTPVNSQQQTNSITTASQRTLKSWSWSCQTGWELTECFQRCWQTGMFWWETSGSPSDSTSWSQRHPDAPRTPAEPDRRVQPENYSAGFVWTCCSAVVCLHWGAHTHTHTHTEYLPSHLVVVSLNVSWKLRQVVPSPAPPTSSVLTSHFCANSDSQSTYLHPVIISRCTVAFIVSGVLLKPWGHSAALWSDTPAAGVCHRYWSMITGAGYWTTQWIQHRCGFLVRFCFRYRDWIHNQDL